MNAKRVRLSPRHGEIEIGVSLLAAGYANTYVGVLPNGKRNALRIPRVPCFGRMKIEMADELSGTSEIGPASSVNVVSGESYFPSGFFASRLIRPCVASRYVLRSV